MSTGVKDSAGNALVKDSVWTFTTEAGDLTAPLVTSVTPLNGAANINPTTNATATFNEAMNASTINGGTVEMRDPSNNLVASAISYDGGTRTVTIDPVSNLSSGTTYTVRIVSGASGVKDVAGNAIATNYVWTFTTTVGDVTAPLVTSTTPANGATSVAPTASITAAFNEPMNASTINSSTVELRDGTNLLLSATISYNAANNTVTITPNATLSYESSYVVLINGGAQGVKDVAGNALATNYSWSFTTAAPPSNAISIFPATNPSPALANDGVGVEVGMKFRSTESGQILGLRYFKGTNFTTGTRVGHLWTSSGTLMASATFVNETPSGWQEVMFTTPISIVANTTYVVSYHSSDGHYTVTNPFFTSAATNGPLRGLVYGEDGPNGLYLYTPTAAFPTSSYGSSNYWVDVVFSSGTF
ncbi:MAG TPA: Ig-like domain-containing protein, partial [Chitinophagaceae bacterium]|nr:Ig-like domain-containing protein [Chitinophagaceae bacterium]